MTTDTIISTRDLSKRYPMKRAAVTGATVAAVSDLTIDVARGELVAFLGPNGAGKSTSLRMLTTLIPPSSGTASVAGRDILREPAEVRRRIGYVGQGNSGSFSQRVRDELLSQGAFYGLSRRASVLRADELIDSLDLSAIATKQVQNLSGGQKRRLDIALGLVHAPELLFLDEPSTGLDPQSRANLWQHILELRRSHGTTVFLTTHYLEEADRYAERVLVMDQGRVIADDTAEALKATLAGDVLTLGFADGDAADAAVATLSAFVGAPVARSDDRDITVTVPEGSALLPRALRELDASGLTVSTATSVPPTLDDVFLALTGRTLREAAASTEADSASGSETKASVR